MRKPSPLESVDEELTAIAIETGLLAPGEAPSGALLAYGYEVISACARVGDGHGDVDNNFGDHIRAVFFPHPLAQLMRMRVYRLRERGRRLPGDEVERRAPDEGDLLFKQRVLQSRIFKALLVRPGDMANFYVIPLLDDAVIVRITSAGLLIAGREVVSTGVRRHQTHEYQQSWWCVSPFDPAIPGAALSR